MKIADIHLNRHQETKNSHRPKHMDVTIVKVKAILMKDQSKIWKIVEEICRDLIRGKK